MTKWSVQKSKTTQREWTSLSQPKQEMLKRNTIAIQKCRTEKKSSTGVRQNIPLIQLLHSQHSFLILRIILYHQQMLPSPLYSTTSFRSLLNTENTMEKKESIILPNGWRQKMKKHAFKLRQRKEKGFKITRISFSGTDSQIGLLLKHNEKADSVKCMLNRQYAKLAPKE